MQQFYYAHTIRNITIAFLDMFNDISVQRYTDMSFSAVAKTIPVPIMFGPVEKFHQTRKEESLVRFYQSIPRMAIMLESVEYNSDRCTAANETRSFIDPVSGTEINFYVADVQPTPYDLTFRLQIKSDSMSDFSQILENILPYFNPSLDLRVKEFSFLNLERDLKVILENVTPEFSEEIDETGTRFINGTLTFRIHAYMYRPIDSAKIIKKIDSRYIIPNNLDLASVSATYYEQFSTSGFRDISASPGPTQFETSGTTEDNKLWYKNISFYNL